MTLTKWLLVAAAVAVLCLALFAPAHSKERECYPLGTLKVSFSVVFPTAKQTLMKGDEAKEYLRIYNSYGKPTDVDGENLLMVTLPNGTNLFVPVKGNIGCDRHVVGPRLHRMILIKMVRGRT